MTASQHRTGLSVPVAYSIIELVGVLAILAILATLVSSSVIKRIDDGAARREAQDMSGLGDALLRSIQVEKRIPAAGEIAATIANYRNLSRSQVLTNQRGFGRVFLLDPSADVAGNNLQSTAYVQGNSGAPTAPTHARVLLLSTLTAPALGSIPGTSFDDIWNTAEGMVPSALGARRADDIKIQRVDIGPLFRNLHLHNVDLTDASYAVETNVPSSVAGSGAIRSGYFLQGTVINLLADGTNLLQMCELLTEDRSFVFQAGRWSADLTTPKISAALGPFGSAVSAFLDAGWNDPENGARPQAVVETFYSYMVNYIIWSQGDSAHGITNWQGNGLGPQYPYFKRLGDTQLELDSVSSDLIN